MKFGRVPVAQAEGTVLAHSLQMPDGRWRKGRVLSTADIADLAKAGIADVIAAKMDESDVAEDAAAQALAGALVDGDTGLIAEAPFTGRVNLRSSGPGILRVDAAAVARLNAIDPAVTLATLPQWQRVVEGMMVGTVKIIPYAVPKRALEAAMAEAAGALSLVRPVLRKAALIVTQLPGAKGEEKGIAATANRLRVLGVTLPHVETVPHETSAVAEALARTEAELVLILTASATSDEADIGPAGLVAAGGELKRFGMPVDPGNLLFLGAVSGRPVIGLPGCARSPALNGADWVLERVICGVPPSAEDIAAMGVGGLLKEIPTRPQPRERPRKGGARG